MEQFSELVRLRRSIRKFTPEPIAPDDVALILRAALMAPTSKGTHSYEFIVVEDKAQLQALAQCKMRGGEFVAEAPLAVVVGAAPEVSDVWIEDASVASTHILLQAEDLGLGACWVQVRGRMDAEGGDAEENVRQTLGLPPGLRILSIIALGHKAALRKPQDEERLLWEKVHVGRW